MPALAERAAKARAFTGVNAPLGMTGQGLVEATGAAPRMAGSDPRNRVNAEGWVNRPRKQNTEQSWRMRGASGGEAGDAEGEPGATDGAVGECGDRNLLDARAAGTARPRVTLGSVARD